MPVFLDQSLRKVLIRELSHLLEQNPNLKGEVRVLDQETFLPTVANQIIFTDLDLQNEPLSPSNRIADLYGKVTFVAPEMSKGGYLFWAQENPKQHLEFDQGFYFLELVSKHSDDTPDNLEWFVQGKRVPRVVSTSSKGVGLKICLESILDDRKNINPADWQVHQDMEVKTYGVDYGFVGSHIYLKRFHPNTRIYNQGIDITKDCTYYDMGSFSYVFRGIDVPLQLPPNILRTSVSVWNKTLNRPLVGWSLVGDRLEWKNPTQKGIEVVVSYYEKKPLISWDLPSNYIFTLSGEPLLNSDGTPNVVVGSSSREFLPASAYEVSATQIRILEPLPNEVLTIDYRYLNGLLDPVKVEKFDIRSDILPGVTLTFSDNFTDKDRIVIIVHDQEKPIGLEHGGLNRVNLTVKIRSVDDSFLENMTKIVFFMFTDEASRFTLEEHGIIAENSASYARSVEERDDNGEKAYVNSFKLSVLHSWRYLEPYVQDLNTVGLNLGVLKSSGKTGGLTFSDLLFTKTELNVTQAY